MFIFASVLLLVLMIKDLRDAVSKTYEKDIFVGCQSSYPW